MQVLKCFSNANAQRYSTAEITLEIQISKFLHLLIIYNVN